MSRSIVTRIFPVIDLGPLPKLHSSCAAAGQGKLGCGHAPIQRRATETGDLDDRVQIYSIFRRQSPWPLEPSYFGIGRCKFLALFGDLGLEQFELLFH